MITIEDLRQTTYNNIYRLLHLLSVKTLGSGWSAPIHAHR